MASSSNAVDLGLKLATVRRETWPIAKEENGNVEYHPTIVKLKKRALKKILAMPGVQATIDAAKANLHPTEDTEKLLAEVSLKAHVWEEKNKQSFMVTKIQFLAHLEPMGEVLVHWPINSRPEEVIQNEAEGRTEVDAAKKSKSVKNGRNPKRPRLMDNADDEEDLQDKIKRLEAENAEKDRELKKIQEKLIEKEKVLDQSQSDTRTFKNYYDLATADIKKLEKAHSEQVAQLKKELLEEKEKGQSLENKLMGTIANNQAHLEKIEEAHRERLEKMAKKYQKIQEESDDLKKLMQKTQRDGDLDRESLKTENQLLRETLDVTEKEREEHSRRVGQLLLENERLLVQSANNQALINFGSSELTRQNLMITVLNNELYFYRTGIRNNGPTPANEQH